MTVFSFHPVKMITTGEGGMILTNRLDLYQRLLSLRSHGITKDPDAMEGESEGPWYYQQVGLGFNYRLTDLQAALGVSQMDRLDDFVARRRLLAARYDHMLRTLPLSTPWQKPGTTSSYHLYVVTLDPSRTGKSRRWVFDELKQRGIAANVHYIPIHTQPYYRNLGFRNGDYPMSEVYYANAITLPLYYDLTETQQDRVVSELFQALAK
jgi:dTDP-4-amino-4,6-dideoxygalactose transaminase